MSELSEPQKENLLEIDRIEDDDINYTDMPKSTMAQLARAVKGPYSEARKILRARSEAGRPAREAFWAAVKPITLTDAFRHWFTGSKAVAEEEKPRVLFHGLHSAAMIFTAVMER